MAYKGTFGNEYTDKLAKLATKHANIDHHIQYNASFNKRVLQYKNIFE